MKSLTKTMNDSINESRNYPYSVAFNIKGKIITTDIKLRYPSDANLFDEWLESEINNDIYHADGGPNDIEL